jgi:threonine dehydratase
MSTSLPVTLADVFAARRRIAAHVRRTPLVPSGWLTRTAGSDVSLKLESLQVTHSFKARGALNAAMRLKERAGSNAVIVTASAGNHGRAIAWAAERLNLQAIVFTPRDAPRTKLDAIRRHGADLRAEAQSYEDAERRAQEWARTTGETFISPYDHPDVIAGAGTVAIELMEDDPHLDVVLVPIGGGGLVSGIAAAMHGLAPSASVIGVEAEASTPFTAARAAGSIVTVHVGPTIADGLGGNVDPQTMTWPFIRDLVRHVAVVPEQVLRQSVRELAAEEHLVAEGAGVAAAAAVAGGVVRLEGRRAAAILTGANIDVSRLAALLGRDASPSTQSSE